MTNDCWCCPYKAGAPACFVQCKHLPTRSREFSCSLSKTGRQRFPSDTASQQNPGAKAKRQAVHKQSHTCYSNAGSGEEKVRAVRFKESGVVSHDPPESVCVRCAQTLALGQLQWRSHTGTRVKEERGGGQEIKLYNCSGPAALLSGPSSGLRPWPLARWAPALVRHHPPCCS